MDAHVTTSALYLRMTIAESYARSASRSASESSAAYAAALSLNGPRLTSFPPIVG